MESPDHSQDWLQWMHWDCDEDTAIVPNFASSEKSTASFQTSKYSRPHSSSSNVYPITLNPRDLLTASLQDPLTPSSSANSPEEAEFLELQQPSTSNQSKGSFERASRGRKRKAVKAVELPDENENTQPQQCQPAEKRPHNLVEKRYRANLNEKIADLRESVPSLRNLRLNEGESATNSQTGIVASQAKLNKSNVLTKAVEYIHQLELRNKKIEGENAFLKERLLQLEKLLAADETTAKKRATAFTFDRSIERKPLKPMSDAEQKDRLAKHPPNGLIPVPENMRRLRQNQPQNHYADRYDTRQGGHKAKQRWPAKILLGSVAGLMVVDGLSDRQKGPSSQGKGLFGIPLEFLDGWWFLQSPRAFLVAFMQYCRAGGVLPLVKGFCALTLLAFVVFYYLFNSRPMNTNRAEKPPPSSQILPSLASPITVRHQAWLTSMHTLKLPHHAFFPEWLAVTMEWLKYTIRLVIGASSYHKITGKSEEDEMARIKAWDIGIDAQLAGGDAEISRSRLVLSIFASGTLPQSPARLMLKALHCRIVLWKVGRGEGRLSQVSNYAAACLASIQWKKAQSIATELETASQLALPNHLKNLLQYDCKDVMLDAVLELLYSLIYRASNSKYCSDAGNLMDVVMEDNAVRSPLDAVAAWLSSQRLHEALIRSTTSAALNQPAFSPSLDAALKIAPPLSAAHARTLAFKALLFSQDRVANMQRVTAALSSGTKQGSASQAPPFLGTPSFIDSSIPICAREDICKVLTCARIMIELCRDQTESEVIRIHDGAYDVLFSLDFAAASLTLFTFAAIFYVVSQFEQMHDKIKDQHIDESEDSRKSKEPMSPSHHTNYVKIISELATWARSQSVSVSSPPSIISPAVLAKLRKLQTQSMRRSERERSSTRRQSNASHDTGYGSLSETEC